MGNNLTPDASYKQAFEVYKSLQYRGKISESVAYSKRIKITKKQIDFILKSIVNIMYENNNLSAKGLKCGYVYAISNPAWGNYIKIGSTVDVYDRLNSYQTSSPHRDYKLLGYVFSPDRLKLEEQIHSLFERKNEWILNENNINFDGFLNGYAEYPENEINEFCFREIINISGSSDIVKTLKKQQKIKHILKSHFHAFNKFFNISLEQLQNISYKSKTILKHENIYSIQNTLIKFSEDEFGNISLL